MSILSWSQRIKEAGYEIIIMSIAGTDSTKALFKSSITTKDMSEDDKISQMMSDSGDFYNQKNWLQLRGRSAYAGQKVPQNYKCNRCNQSGHFIYDCPQGKNSSLPSELKRTTGIPRSFLQPATAETPCAKIYPCVIGNHTFWLFGFFLFFCTDMYLDLLKINEL